jgi:hypothetical protein
MENFNDYDSGAEVQTLKFHIKGFYFWPESIKIQINMELYTLSRTRIRYSREYW